MNNPVKYKIIDDVEWIGESEIQGRLYDIGKYPGALPANNKRGGSIKGEILKIKHPERILKILDQYEGFNPNELNKSEYYRAQEKINLPDGSEIKAWVYWYNFPVEGKKRIRHKDYLDYLKKKNLFKNE
jgi:gamma-glutamylcyclotransferase (GGCT)/AIG2-like uncharacterized protein YtfP